MDKCANLAIFGIGESRLKLSDRAENPENIGTSFVWIADILATHDTLVVLRDISQSSNAPSTTNPMTLKAVTEVKQC